MSDNDQKNLKNKEVLVDQDFFKFRLTNEMQRVDRLGSTFCIAVIHFDTPKIKGASYPKQTLNQYFFDAIANTIRNIDIAYKDERGDFLILLTEVNDQLAEKVVQRIIEKLPFLKNDEVKTNISVGIANFPTDSKTVEELLQAAKFAMINSQQKGNNVVTLSSSLRNNVSWKKEADEAYNSTRKKLNKVIESTIKSLLSTFATKDEYLEVHSVQVSKIAQILAEQVGLKERYQEEITLAALLHDVGYLEISNEILYKPGKLDKFEFQIIQQHPEIATEKILKPIKSFKNILPIILDHHERWDGEGYPNNKSEKQIHIGARIISIADAFHALSSNRPYRDSYNRNEIIKIMESGSNLAWDAVLLESFFELLKDEKVAKLFIERRQ